MKIKGLRWWMIGLVTCGTILNYLARNTLAVAAPTFMAELHISTQQYSYIVAAFQACYMFMQPVAGFLLDLLGTKIGFALFAVAWSAANLVHGFASGWISLALFRGLLGMSEASVIPAGLKASSEWFPAKERSIATGWFNIGSSIGGLIAPPLVVWCILHSGWQSAFMVTGGIGFIWAAMWLKFYKHPKDQKSLTDEERDYILDGQEAQHKVDYEKPSWKSIVACRQFWGIALPRFLAEPAWQTFNFWLPLYMMTVHHMNLKSIAMFAWIPFLAADLGCIVGGYLPAFFLKYMKVNLITSRKLVVVMGAVLMIRPGSIGLVANGAEMLAELVRRNVHVDVVTDQTPAHDPLSYVPAGMSLGDAAEMRGANPTEYVRRSRASMAAHCAAMVELMDRGAEVFDYGNSLRTEAALGGFERAFSYPGFIPAYIRPLFCAGKGPFRWVALSGDAADIAATDDAVLQLFGEDARLARWITMARERVAFQGLPARICWLGYGERERAGMRFNEMVASGAVRAPIVIGRDHLDAGSVASPYRETEAMLDGSDAIADWPLLNALVNTASGASWVSIHHGGGVGIGRSVHAGQVTVADGTALAGEKLARVLTNDPAMGVLRHVDAGYEQARAVASAKELRVPMSEGT